MDIEAWRVSTDQRIRDLEKGAAVEVAHRVDVVRRLTGIEDTLKKLVWIVITAVLGAMVAFMLKGGFVIG